MGSASTGSSSRGPKSLVQYLIKERPTDSRYWLAYANILLSENRKLEATVLLETAAGTGVASVEEFLMLGDLYAEQGLVPEAADIYRKVLASEPEVGGQKLLHYAEVLISSGRLDDAQRVLGTMKPEGSGRGAIELHQARADLLAAQKKWPEAREELDALLKLAPLNGRALISLGRAYAAEDDLPRATLSFEAAYRIPAGAYVAGLELANIELRNRHYAKSAEYLQKALSIEKTDAVQDLLARVKTLIVNDQPNP